MQSRGPHEVRSTTCRFAGRHGRRKPRGDSGEGGYGHTPPRIVEVRPFMQAEDRACQARIVPPRNGSSAPCSIGWSTRRGGEACLTVGRRKALPNGGRRNRGGSQRPSEAKSGAVQVQRCPRRFKGWQPEGGTGWRRVRVGIPGSRRHGKADGQSANARGSVRLRPSKGVGRTGRALPRDRDSSLVRATAL